uniref:Cation efflux protein transmembrane domain-containing protein n=1 Tax=Aegilops tauschii subsp. strangulata TaxID=200361 RepID=A0A453I338_AEGTS
STKALPPRLARMGLRFAHLAGGVARAAISRRGPHLSPACARRVLAPLASPGEPSGGNWLVPSRGHGGHSNHHGEESVEASEKIFRLGLAADVVLTVGKAITGYLSGSTAITADAAHSLSDIVLSGVALLSYKAAKVPRDKDHPYGHGKFESLGALGISSMLLITAGSYVFCS